MFALYTANMTPGKSRSMRYHDERCAKMWTRVLGAQQDVSKLTPSELREAK